MSVQVAVDVFQYCGKGKPTGLPFLLMFGVPVLGVTIGGDEQAEILLPFTYGFACSFFLRSNGSMRVRMSSRAMK